MMIDPDEEEDMERFEIDDRDIEFAINPGARRGLTKSQQLYGEYLIELLLLEHTNASSLYFTDARFVGTLILALPPKKVKNLLAAHGLVCRYRMRS